MTTTSMRNHGSGFGADTLVRRPDPKDTPAGFLVRTMPWTRGTAASALPSATDIVRPGWHVSNVPIADSCTAAKRVTLSAWASAVYSGNPAFRRPSISSFAFDCPPRAIHADIVKPGSVSSTRAAASLVSASRPRWANADARQRSAPEWEGL